MEGICKKTLEEVSAKAAMSKLCLNIVTLRKKMNWNVTSKSHLLETQVAHESFPKNHFDMGADLNGDNADRGIDIAFERVICGVRQDVVELNTVRFHKCIRPHD